MAIGDTPSGAASQPITAEITDPTAISGSAKCLTMVCSPFVKLPF
jgi:hypothetical protein